MGYTIIECPVCKKLVYGYIEDGQKDCHKLFCTQCGCIINNVDDLIRLQRFSNKTSNT